MSAPLVFLDTETTGLDPGNDDIWEIAWTVRNNGSHLHYHAFVQHDVNKAMALPDEFRKDWARRYDPKQATTMNNLLVRLRTSIPEGAHLVGACPWFDQAFLEPEFRRFYGAHHLQPPFRYGWVPWHYHLIDVEALAVGYYLADTKTIMNGAQRDAITPPWNSNDLSLMLGVDPDTFPRHTASGDVAWAMAMYDAILPSEEML